MCFVLHCFTYLFSGFTLYYKRDHSDWKMENLGPQNRTYTATKLRCGTQYRFHMRAYNLVGEGLPSHSVSAKTNGSGKLLCNTFSNLSSYYSCLYTFVCLCVRLDYGNNKQFHKCMILMVQVSTETCICQ